ncbi:MAG: hypothetical protein GXP62_19745 [Oligoflexia bacterium]|nr:hypothetical protein [Oligoflexia bacterium]
MLLLPMTTGCPFFLPFIEVEQNVPPSIDYSSPGEGDTLEIKTEQYTAFVVAQDPDDTDLSFFWTIDGYGTQGDAVAIRSGTQIGSQLTISRDQNYDQHILTVIVYDPQGASDQRSWPIEVLEQQP